MFPGLWIGTHQWSWPDSRNLQNKSQLGKCMKSETSWGVSFSDTGTKVVALTAFSLFPLSSEPVVVFHTLKNLVFWCPPSRKASETELHMNVYVLVGEHASVHLKECNTTSMVPIQWTQAPNGIPPPRWPIIESYRNWNRAAYTCLVMNRQLCSSASIKSQLK